jgi:hypothetical protein
MVRIEIGDGDGDGNMDEAQKDDGEVDVAEVDDAGTNDTHKIHAQADARCPFNDFAEVDLST